MTDSPDLVSLRHYVERLFEEQRRTDDAFRTGHSREHEMLALALRTSSEDLQSWKRSANEWRDTLRDLKGEFATREYAEQQDAIVRAIVEVYIKRVAELEAVNFRTSGVVSERDRQSERRMWFIGLVVGAAFGVVSLIVNWVINR